MKIRIFLIFLIAFTACDHPATEKAMQGIQGGLDQAQQQLDSLKPVAEDVSQKTQEQVNKVVRFEYKVVALPSDVTSEQLETTLNTLGMERWECFSILPREKGVTVSCRRVPYALLRSMLKVF